MNNFKQEQRFGIMRIRLHLRVDELKQKTCFKINELRRDTMFTVQHSLLVASVSIGVAFSPTVTEAFTVLSRFSNRRGP